MPIYQGMFLPIDTAGMAFVVNRDPRPVTEFNSPDQRTDRDGRPLWSVEIYSPVFGEVVPVRVAGDVPEVRKGQQVRLPGLVVQPWQMKNGKQGVTFHADAVLPATGKAAA